MDIIITAELPEDLKNELQLYSCCVSGASGITSLECYLGQAGFNNISITPKDESKEFIKDWVPGHKVEDYTVAAIIQAEK